MHRTRKLLSLLLALVFMVGLLPAVAPVHAHAVAADSTCEVTGGAHNWVHDLAADCTHGGMETWTCSNCHLERDDSHWVDALGHSWSEWDVTPGSTPPDCTHGGTESRYCKRCGETETRSVGPLGHSWGAWGYGEDSNGNPCPAPTCTQGGKQVRFCSRCGESETQSVPALGHSWDNGTVTREATCTADGSKTVTCTRCGETKTESIPALGHNYETTVTQEPTCTEAGKQTVACTRGDDTHEETIPALGHDWDAGETVEPHGLTEGSVTHTCKRCGVTETETIPVSASSLFNRLRDIPPEAAQDGFEWPDELVIVTQPVGGTINHDGGSRTLSIEVEGGEAPYTYEWRSVGGLNYQDAVRGERGTSSDSSTVDAIYGFAQSLANSNGSSTQTQSNLTSFVQGRRNSATQSYRRAGHSAAQAFYPMDQHDLAQAFLDAVMLNDSPIFATAMANGDGPEYEVTRAGTYFCRVTDSVGQVKESDQVTVGYKLYIVQQPQNANLNGKDSVTLSCTAAGGVAPYYSALYNAEDGHIVSVNEKGCTFEVDTEGEYYIVVQDEEHETAKTVTVRVYNNAEPVWVEPAQTIYNMTPAEDNLIEFSFGGGSAPYTLEWYHYGVLYETVGFAVNEADTIPLRIPEDGEYGLEVTDANGDTAYKTCMVFFDASATPEPSVPIEGEKPVITHQPKSVTLEYREDGKYGSTCVSCAAVSPATGDDSNLTYLWEFCDDAYGWVPVYQGSAFPVPAHWIGYSYRCKVTDNETGEYVYSDTASVQVGLTCDLTGYQTGQYSTLSYLLTYTIHGGTAPYKVDVRERRVMWIYDSETDSDQRQTVDAYVISETQNVAGTHEIYNGVEGLYWSGAYTWAEYYLVVTDATGQSCTSNTFNMADVQKK